MRQYIELGPVPTEEDCQQVGTTGYDPYKARLESGVYARQLLRMFPDCHFDVKSFPHEFGSYREVVVYYHEDVPEEVAAAYHAERNLPENWDEIAQNELQPHTI